MIFRDFLAESDSPVVFCHNDTQGGNILLRKDDSLSMEERLMIIDYEFCGYNYRAYDIVCQCV